MKWHEVRRDEVFASPWRNGGGTTRELLAWPHRDDWQVRASVAETGRGGPFPPRPGVVHWFCALSGDGVTLRVGGQDHRLDKGSGPLRFDGGLSVECELAGGATEDFHLMLLGREGTLERVRGRREVACKKGSLVGVYSHEHEVVFLAVEVRTVVPPRTLAWNIVPMDERIDFETEGALWFEAAP